MCFTPCTYPQANLWIRGISIPPTNPTAAVSLFIAAKTPTRNEPSCSLKIMDCTFGRSTTISMMLNLVFGNSFATLVNAAACPKPTAITGSEPLLASLRRNCSRWASCVTSNSRYLIPVSLRNFSSPFQIPSLNDLSNLPPMSKSTAGLKANACDALHKNKPASRSAESILFITFSLINRKYFRNQLLKNLPHFTGRKWDSPIIANTPQY